MALSDQQFRIATIVGGVVLVGVIISLRFCSSLSLPEKPSPPKAPTGTQRQLLSQSAGSPAVYQDFLKQDATSAGVAAPTLEDMSKKLPYRVDEARHVLEPGQPAVELAGLRLHLERSGESVLLVIRNLLPSAVAYEVATTPSTGAYICNSARPLSFNAMTIDKGGTQTRTECAWRSGESIAITKVETLEVTPLAAWYLAQTPPKLVGIEDRIGRGHRGVEGAEPCSTVVSQRVGSGIESGEIGWRDLADFYARHRCQSYQFPSSYRAFKSDGERQLPAVD